MVSLSSYDIQQASQSEMDASIAYVESFMKPPRINIPFSRRVFIGEFGLPSRKFNYDDNAMCKANLNILLKFVNLNLPFILFWAMYNNELTPDNKQVGYWLINDNNVATPMYNIFSKYYSLTEPQDPAIYIQNAISIM